MKITAKTARETVNDIIARREEERRQASLDYLDGSLTDAIIVAVNNGESGVTVRTNKELDWDLIEAELRKEENGFSATRPASNNGTLRIGW